MERTQYLKPEGKYLLVKLATLNVPEGSGLPVDETRQVYPVRNPGTEVACGTIQTMGEAAKTDHQMQNILVYFDLSASRLFFDAASNEKLVIVHEDDIYASRRNMPISTKQPGSGVPPRNV